ncbi:MAG: hypothetical protein H0U05_07255 [Actinobacteria bacterium]|nr:hypothetical protein [Actinomycetota bacterium]
MRALSERQRRDPVDHLVAQLLEVGVDARDLHAVERVCESIADPFEGCEIAADRCPISGHRVDESLTQPEIEPSAVELSGRPVAELEIEGGLARIEGRVRRAPLSHVVEQVARFDAKPPR